MRNSSSKSHLPKASFVDKAVFQNIAPLDSDLTGWVPSLLQMSKQRHRVVMRLVPSYTASK